MIIDPKVKQVFAALQSQTAFEGAPIITATQTIIARTNTLKTTAMGYVGMTALWTSLTNIIASLTSIVTYAEYIQGALPNLNPGPTQYDLQVRMSLMSTSIGLLTGQLDSTDSDTVAIKRQKFFPLTEIQDGDITNWDSLLSILEAASSSMGTLLSAYTTNMSAIDTVETALAGKVAAFEAVLAIEIHRIQLYAFATGLNSAKNDANILDILNIVATPNLKTILGI